MGIATMAEVTSREPAEMRSDDEAEAVSEAAFLTVEASD